MHKYPKTLIHPALPAMTARSPDEEEQLAARGYAPVKITPYTEFPKALVHPDYAPARMISPEKHGAPVSSDYPEAALARLCTYTPAVWEPERFPAVIANNAEEERKFVTLGYRAAGAPDAAAFAAAHASPGQPRSEPAPYPKWVTPPNGEPFIVKSEAEECALRSKWVETKGKNTRSGVTA
jgi:hypothetical protein